MTQVDIRLSFPAGEMLKRPAADILADLSLEPDGRVTRPDPRGFSTYGHAELTLPVGTWRFVDR